MGAMAENRRIRLGELLISAKVITEAQLRAALAEQKKWGGKLGATLVEMKFLSEEMLVKALSKQLNLPRVDFNGLTIPPEALEKIEPVFAERHQVLPVAYDAMKKQLVLAMSDPEQISIIDDISFRTGCRVKVALAGEKALAEAIRRLYFGQDLSERPGEDNESMKLINPLGNTLVRKLDSIRPPEPTPAQPSGPPSMAEIPAGSGSVEERLARLEALQRRELRVLKAVVDTLIEKGVISREEYRQKIDS